MGALEEALEQLQHVSRAVPDEAAPQLALANTLVLLDREEEAVDRYRTVLELEPGHISATGNLAVVLLRLGETEEGPQRVVEGVQGYAAIDDRVSALELLEFGLEVARSVGVEEVLERLEELREHLAPKRDLP